MNVQELINKFREIAEADSNIGSFSFDDLPSVNIDRQKLYPLILLKTPQAIEAFFLWSLFIGSLCLVLMARVKGEN